MKKYIVKQYADTLDTAPTTSEPLEWYEAEDLAEQWLSDTVDYCVQHSPYMLSEEDVEHLRAQESALIIIEEHTA